MLSAPVLVLAIVVAAAFVWPGSVLPVRPAPSPPQPRVGVGPRLVGMAALAVLVTSAWAMSFSHGRWFVAWPVNVASAGAATLRLEPSSDWFEPELVLIAPGHRAEFGSTADLTGWSLVAEATSPTSTMLAVFQGEEFLHHVVWSGRPIALRTPKRLHLDGGADDN